MEFLGAERICMEDIQLVAVAVVAERDDVIGGTDGTGTLERLAGFPCPDRLFPPEDERTLALLSTVMLRSNWE